MSCKTAVLNLELQAALFVNNVKMHAYRRGENVQGMLKVNGITVRLRVQFL